MTFTPGPTPNTVRAADGTILTAPDGWALLPPGDAALTRRVKEAGDHWVVQEKKGRKIFSRGVWAADLLRMRHEVGENGVDLRPRDRPRPVVCRSAGVLLGS